MEGVGAEPALGLEADVADDSEDLTGDEAEFVRHHPGFDQYPHRGHVHLEDRDGRQWLVHCLAEEEVLLPKTQTGGPWGLAFLLDGTGFVYDTTVCTQEEEFVDAFFHRKLWQKVGTNVLWMDYGDFGEDAEQGFVMFAELLNMFTNMDVTLEVGATRTDKTLAVATFEWHRGGARAFWSLPQIVSAAHFSVARQRGVHLDKQYDEEVDRTGCKTWHGWPGH